MAGDVRAPSGALPRDPSGAVAPHPTRGSAPNPAEISKAGRDTACLVRFGVVYIYRNYAFK